MSDPPAIWMELLHQSAEQLADLLKRSRTDRVLRKRGRTLLHRAFQLEIVPDPKSRTQTTEEMRHLVFELDELINALTPESAPEPASSLETSVSARYNHDAIKLWGGTRWRELIRWLEHSEEMHDRMLSRIDWLVKRSEQAAARMGGVRVSEATADEQVTPRENFELVRKAERKKRRR